MNNRSLDAITSEKNPAAESSPDDQAIKPAAISSMTTSVKNKILGFFGEDKAQSADTLSNPANDTQQSGAPESTIQGWSKDHVTLKQFLDVRYDKEAKDIKTRQPIWLEIEPKAKIKSRKNTKTFALNPEEPDNFLLYLASQPTSVIARTLKANRHRLGNLSTAIKFGNNNPALYICYALLTDDITSLDPDKLVAAEKYIKDRENTYSRFAKTISVMLELREPKNHETFAESIKQRNDDYLNLSGMKFTNIEFLESNLDYIDMRNTSFTNCLFKSCSMRHVDFDSAIFSKVKMINLNLSNSNFSKCKFMDLTKDEIIFQRATFISLTSKLTAKSIEMKLNALLQLAIPPYVVMNNVYRNLANKSLKYTLLEKHEILGVLGLHKIFNTSIPEPAYDQHLHKYFPIRHNCLETIKRDWEDLALKISARLNPTSYTKSSK